MARCERGDGKHGRMPMWNNDETEKQSRHAVTLGEDLSTFSIGDIDERISALEAEIARLKEERSRKSGSLEAAQSFFKKA